MANTTFHSITLPGVDPAVIPNFADEFNTGNAYSVKDYCTYQGVLYRCIIDHPEGTPWNSSHFIPTDLDTEFDRKLDIPISQTSAPTNPRVGDLWIDNDQDSPIYNVDVSPTLGSTNAVQSGGTKIALNSLDSRKMEHGIITGDFSASVDYRVGDLVFYATTANGITTRTLYRCIVNHNATAWNAAHFTATTLEVELQKVRDSEASTDMIAEAFGTSNSYTIGDCVIYNTDLYRCISDVSDTGSWDPDYWKKINIDTELYNLNNAIKNPGIVQLVQNGNFETERYWQKNGNGTITVHDNILTFTVGDPNVFYAGIFQEANFIAGHKYLVNADVQLSFTSSVCRIGSGSAVGVSYYGPISANTWTNISIIKTAQLSQHAQILFSPSNKRESPPPIGGVASIKNFMIIDLTASFGEGNEPTIEKFKSVYNNYIDTNRSGGDGVWKEIQLGTVEINNEVNNLNSNYNKISQLQTAGNIYQKIKNGNFNNNANWTIFGNYEIADNIITITASTITINTGIEQLLNSPYILNHKYLFMGEVYCSKATNTFRFGGSQAASLSTFNSLEANKWTKIQRIYTCGINSDTSYFYCKPFNQSGISETDIIFKAKNLMCFDLTKMFGEGNEPTIDNFNKNYGTSYIDFNEFEGVSNYREIQVVKNTLDNKINTSWLFSQDNSDYILYRDGTLTALASYLANCVNTTCVVGTPSNVTIPFYAKYSLGKTYAGLYADPPTFVYNDTIVYNNITYPIFHSVCVPFVCLIVKGVLYEESPHFYAFDCLNNNVEPDLETMIKKSFGVYTKEESQASWAVNRPWTIDIWNVSSTSIMPLAMQMSGNPLLKIGHRDSRGGAFTFYEDVLDQAETGDILFVSYFGSTTWWKNIEHVAYFCRDLNRLNEIGTERYNVTFQPRVESDSANGKYGFIAECGELNLSDSMDSFRIRDMGSYVIAKPNVCDIYICKGRTNALLSSKSNTFNYLRIGRDSLVI